MNFKIKKEITMKKTVSLLLALLTALSLNIWGALGAYATSVGDINDNGKIDMTDYILLKRAYFGTYDLTEIQNRCGDINGNDKIDMTDYILLKRIYFGTYSIGGNTNQAPDEPLVSDALNYEKDVVSLYPDTDFGKHTYRLPKINGDTINIKEFNDGLFDCYSNGYNLLLNDEEGDYIMNVDYEYRVHNGLVSIMIKSYVGVQMAGVYCDINVHYYDLNADHPITYNEYLAALGTDAIAVRDYLYCSDEYLAEFGYDFSGYISGLMADGDSLTYVIDEMDNVIDGMSVTFELNNGLF